MVPRNHLRVKAHHLPRAVGGRPPGGVGWVLLGRRRADQQGLARLGARRVLITMRLPLVLVLVLAAAGPAPAGSQPMAVPPAAGQSAACSQVRDPGLRALCRAQISLT